jgi:hypothetical protein
VLCLRCAQSRRVPGIISLPIRKTRDRLICTSRNFIVSKVQPFAPLSVAFTNGKKTAQHSLSVTGTTARPAIQSESYTAG